MDKILKKASMLFLAIFSACFATRTEFRFEETGLPEIVFDFEEGDVTEAKCRRSSKRIFEILKSNCYIPFDQESLLTSNYYMPLDQELYLSEQATILVDGEIEGDYNCKGQIRPNSYYPSRSCSNITIAGPVKGKLVLYNDAPALIFKAFGKTLVAEYKHALLYGDDSLTLTEADPALSIVDCDTPLKRDTRIPLSHLELDKPRTWKVMSDRPSGSAIHWNFSPFELRRVLVKPEEAEGLAEIQMLYAFDRGL